MGDVLAELNAVADTLDQSVSMGGAHTYRLAIRLRAVAAQIAEREWAIAEAVRERAAEQADVMPLSRPSAIAAAIRTLDLAPILEKSHAE